MTTLFIVGLLGLVALLISLFDISKLIKKYRER